MLSCVFSQNELYPTVTRIVENDYLTIEANVSGITAIQRMGEMANDILLKREHINLQTIDK